MAKFRELDLIPRLYKVLKKEGFGDVECKYIGGMWVWIEFYMNIKRNKDCKRYFSQIQPITKNFIPDKRIMWLDIDGLLLNAYSLNTFKRIVAIWEQIIFCGG